MKILFWFSCAVIAYTYFGYPLYIWAKSLVAPRPWKQAEIYPTVTVIMAVHNGAAIIWQKIEHLLSLDYPADKYDVIVVSDGSNDGTNDILQGITDPRLRTIICPEHVGKAVALNHGMRAAAGEILLFVDIRPMPRTDALSHLVRNFADPTVGCATGELVLQQQGDDAGMRAVGGLYWRYEQWIRNCEALVDSPLGVPGAFYAIRREIASEFPARTILDDMYQPLSIVRKGYRAVLDLSASATDWLPKTVDGEFKRKVRTLAGNFQLLQLAPWLLGSQNRLRVALFSHKLLRLCVPPLLIIIFITSLLLHSSLLYRMFFSVQLTFYVIACAGLLTPRLGRMTGPASAFLMLNVAVVAAFCQFLFHGKDVWKIWTPSARLISVADDTQVAK